MYPVNNQIPVQFHLSRYKTVAGDMASIESRYFTAGRRGLLIGWVDEVLHTQWDKHQIHSDIPGFSAIHPTRFYGGKRHQGALCVLACRQAGPVSEVTDWKG